MLKKAKPDKYQISDRIIRIFLLIIWSLLLIFGLLTILQPKWLMDLSRPGRKEEAEAYINKGNRLLYSANSKNSEAIYLESVSCYQDALKIDSNNREARANIGVAYLYLNQLEDAKAIFEKCLKTDTSACYHYYAYLGDYYERKGDIEKAIHNYLKSSETNPDPAYPLRKAGLFSIYLKKFEDAIKLLNQSISIERSFEYFYTTPLKAARFKAISDNDSINLKKITVELNKSDFSSDLNRYDKISFEDSYKTSKSLGYAYIYLGDAYFGISEYLAAKESYNLSLQYYPSFNNTIKGKLDLTNERIQK